MSENKQSNKDINKNDDNMIRHGFIDWHKYSMDELADYLEDKWKFSSSGDAFAIYKMVKFYRDNKNKI